MVTRKRLRSVLRAIALYTMAALLIGYFGVNAFTGNHGLKAKQDLDLQIAELTRERDRLKTERAQWDRRVSLLRSASLDPDMLDERARASLEYLHPNEITMLRR
jgi:cell division protein FtsB